MAKTKTIENLFVNLAIYSDLLPIFLFFYFFKRIKNNKSAWIIISYLFFDFLINIALLHIPIKFHNKIYPIATFFESLFFAYFFYLTITKKSLRKAIVVASILLSLTSLSYYLYTYYFALGVRRTVHLDSVPIAIETIAIFLFSFFYFFEQINDTENLFVYNKPSFWGVLGIFDLLSWFLFRLHLG